MQLYIGNKNYSSWSLRPWVLLTHFGIPFEERKLRLDFVEGSAFKQAIAQVTPTGRVPVLVDEGFAVWDTLAIAEYVAEKFPERRLWPADARRRARARSVCAEMHSGFTSLRNHCPMNIEASMPEVGAALLEREPELRRDLARIDEMWSGLLAEHGGPFLFGEFSIADAFFAPVCTRLQSYGLPVSATAAAYIERVRAVPAMQAWTKDALAEQDFLQVDEPYRKGPGQPASLDCAS